MGGGAWAEVAVCPEEIPGQWLAAGRHPRVFCSAEGLASARDVVVRTAWGKEYLQRQRRTAARFVAMDADALRALVPPKGCKIVYGLGMNLDPVHRKRMRWGGWKNPFTVTDVKGKVYPNDEWPDRGDGVVDPKTNERLYFLAQAYGHVFKKLEPQVLPALADVWALEGSIDHARTAAVLLDMVAGVYPTNRRGPMDYPTSPKDMDRGGRLDRPYYQTARGLMNYVFVMDMIASSGELEKPSAANHGQSIRENVIRNMLWEGGAYCLDYAGRGYALHNGHADYLRGAALTGLMLDVREFCQPMLEGALSIYAMLAINVDRNGFYYESSPTYSQHACHLYVTIAELVEAAIRLGWDDVRSVYGLPAMRLLLTDSFNRREVGGHVPVVGDDGPDRHVHDPLRRRPMGRPVHSDQYLKGQIENAWVRLVRGPDASDRDAAARLLRDSFGDDAPATPAPTRWSIYSIGMDAIGRIESRKADPKRFETESVFHGAKGLALLRGGKGGRRYGAQLFFGPVNNHGQREALTRTFFAKGAEWSFDPGYFNTHYRFGWTTQTVSHQAMVVDARGYDFEGGTGHLLSWHADADVQWAMASHPTVKRYERLIAQVRDAATGDLGYWLDVGLVEGGELRDDSFHTQMTRAKLDRDLPAADPARPSLYDKIDVNFGDILQDDMRLKGFDDKLFYWTPPGHGYGFLGHPREIDMPETVRVEMSSPAFAKTLNCTIVAHLAGAPGRKLIVADGPRLHNSPRVPYILRRDAGAGTSIFAKLIHVADDGQQDHISEFRQMQVSRPSGRDPRGAGAWCVVWADGRRDLWIVADGGPTHVAASAGLPTVETDAPVALVRFAAAGKPLRVIAAPGTIVQVDGGPTLRQLDALRGRVTAMDPTASPVTVTVDWGPGHPEKLPALTGAPAITTPPNGQPATWRIANIVGRQVTFSDVKPTLAVTDLSPLADRPGWYQMLSGVSRFYSAGGRVNRKYAIGKSIYRGRSVLGRIAEIADDAGSIKIARDGPPVEIPNRFTASILEVGQGDTISVPLTLTWQVRR